jgi:Helix-turn-helix domain/Domain of unknown function (DUF4115)
MRPSSGANCERMTSSQSSAGAYLSDIGYMLREARSKKNVSILEVADALHIKPVFLQALEDEDYSALPGPAYITGFLRNYASYLGLHPDDVVQEYYAARPIPQPSVKAATRVLANGYERHHRKRFLWAFGAVLLILAGGFAIKAYNDTYNRAYSAPLNVTPANLGGTTFAGAPASHVARTVTLSLRAVAPVWVRVTADGHQVYQGILRGTRHHWVAKRSIYVATYDGAHIRVVYNGRPLGLMAHRPGLGFYAATPTGWQHVA